MMIKYTEKLETNIKSELHEVTKWIYKTLIVLHARLYTIARRWIYIKRYTDPIVAAPVAVQWTV